MNKNMMNEINNLVRKHTRLDLIRMCKERNLSYNGNKLDMAERLTSTKKPATICFVKVLDTSYNCIYEIENGSLLISCEKRDRKNIVDEHIRKIQNVVRLYEYQCLYYFDVLKSYFKGNKTFSENESYLHKHAKETLKEWLNQYNEEDDFMSVLCLSETFDVKLRWRSNHIPVEYPLSSKTALQNWNEINYIKDDTKSSYELATLQGHNVVAVIDVVVIHKGCPTYLFEVCHKNPVSATKLNKIKKCVNDAGSDIQYLIEIDAYWIMSQVSRPSMLKVKNIYSL